MLRRGWRSCFSNLISTIKGDGNPIGTIAIRAIDPEYNIITERLTERELKLLQLIVDGYSNIRNRWSTYITVGTVRYVHHILTLC